MSSGVDSKTLVLDAVDIVELIGQTVALKRSGRGFSGLCPFHHEKTPSFHVNAEKRFFYCFGCKEHGNAIDFVMKRDHLPFVDALKLLAERAGVELPKFNRPGESSSERQLLLEAQSAANSYFQQNLAQPVGQATRAYLAKRGFTQDSITRFGLGAATPSWDGLLKSPLMRKFPRDFLVKAGLVRHNEEKGSYYDTFVDRLMFPIRDDQSRVIAFGGRVMPGSTHPAKYLNSPETPIFSKSRCAYGIDLAKQRIVETRTAIILEGYTDVIGCHQFGVTNAVSVLGTALTPEHIKLLRRFADRIVLLFDPDAAGEMAVDRAVQLFLTQPIEIQIATLPEKLDPDEFLLAHGKDAFDKVIADAQDALTHKWKQLDAQFHASEGDLTGQQKAVEQYLQTLADARGSGPVDQLRWGAALTRVSRLTGIPVDELHGMFRNRRPAGQPSRRVPPADGGSETGVVAPVQPKGPRPPLTAQLRAERQTLGCLLAMPRWWHEVQKRVLLDDFLDPANHRLAEVYWDYQKNEGEPEFAEFLVVLKELGLGELAIELFHEAEQIRDFNTTISSAVEYLIYSREQREAAKLRAQLRRSTEGGPEDESAVDLLKKLTEAAKQSDPRRGF